MPLAPFTSSFVDALIKGEKAPVTSVAEAAQKFADSFVGYFEKVGITYPSPGSPTPIIPGSARLPQATKALVGGLTTAFSAKTAADVMSLMEVAFFAYWNAAPISAMFAVAASIAPTTPLSSFMSNLSTPDPSQASAKGKLAADLTSWLCAGPLITLVSPTPGGTANFI